MGRAAGAAGVSCGYARVGVVWARRKRAGKGLRRARHGRARVNGHGRRVLARCFRVHRRDLTRPYVTLRDRTRHSATGGKIRHPARGASTRSKMVRPPCRDGWPPRRHAPAPNGVRRALRPALPEARARRKNAWRLPQNRAGMAHVGRAGRKPAHAPLPRYPKNEASSTAVSSAGNMLASGMRLISSRLMPMPMTISPPVAVSSFITAGPSSG